GRSALQMRCTELTLTPVASAIAAPVQWVARRRAFRRAGPLGAHERDPRPLNVLPRRVAVFDQVAEPIRIGRGDGEGDASSHPEDSHAAGPPESPAGFKCQISSTNIAPKLSGVPQQPSALLVRKAVRPHVARLC